MPKLALQTLWLLATSVFKRSSQQPLTSQARPSQQKESMQVELRQQVALFSEATLKIRQSLQLKDILYTTVTEVQCLLQADRVLCHVLPNRTGKMISESVLPEYPALTNLEFPTEVFPGNYCQLSAQGRTQAIADVQDPAAGLADCFIAFVKQFGMKAKLSVPLISLHSALKILTVGRLGNLSVEGQ